MLLSLPTTPSCTCAPSTPPSPPTSQQPPFPYPFGPAPRQLEDEEDYVADWVVSATWPAGVGGNWGGRGSLPGRLRAGSRNLYYEPDDLRVPIVR